MFSIIVLFLKLIQVEINIYIQNKNIQHIFECDIKKLSRVAKIENPCIKKKRKRGIDIKEVFYVLLKDFLRTPLKLVTFPCQSKFTKFFKNIIDIIFRNALHKKNTTVIKREH